MFPKGPRPIVEQSDDTKGFGGAADRVPKRPYNVFVLSALFKNYGVPCIEKSHPVNAILMNAFYNFVNLTSGVTLVTANALLFEEHRAGG